jgi:hypothetical protein
LYASTPTRYSSIADLVTGTPVNEALVRELATGAFLTEQRNAVLIVGTGTGKSHLGIAIARACIRSGARGRFFNTVDLVRLADYLTRLDFVVGGWGSGTVLEAPAFAQGAWRFASGRRPGRPS